MDDSDARYCVENETPVWEKLNTVYPNKFDYF